MKIIIIQRRMMRVIPVLLFLFSISLQAALPKVVVFNLPEDFTSGDCEQTAISAEGIVTLIPEITPKMKTGEAYVWDIVADSRGTIYVGTGNDGKVFRITAKGDTSVFFDADELEVYTLAVDKADNLYAATAPNGKVYRITPQGQVSIYFEPNETYIWDIAFDAQANLFAATGDSGRIYKITAAGKGSIFYDGTPTHFRVLTFADDGKLLAGSAENGYIYQFDTDGTARVLYDTGYREVHAVEVCRDGSLYAAAYGTRKALVQAIKKKTNGHKKQAVVKKSEDTGLLELPAIQVIADAVSAANGPRLERSSVIKINKYGAAESVWDLNEAVFSLMAEPTGDVWVGTGGAAGGLYEITSDGQNIQITEVRESQVTVLKRGIDAGFWLGTANLGAVYQLTDAYELSGVYTSPEIDAQQISTFGEISWSGSFPKKTSVQFFTRSGNTETVNDTWSEWSHSYTRSAGERITSRPARFLQWKAVLQTKAPAATPELDMVRFSYLQQNLPPKLERVQVNDPEEQLFDLDVNFEEMAAASAKMNGAAAELSPVDLIRKKDRLTRTCRWSCTDPNQDLLVYDVAYQRLGENGWRQLDINIHQQYVRWNSEKWPDGDYRLRVTASDGASTPEAITRKTEKISNVFTIDNAGPLVSDFKLKKDAAGKVTIFFRIQDERTVIFFAEYALDSDPWQVVYPPDTIFDNRTETVEISLGKITTGEHSIVVRTFDRYLNLGFGKFQFHIK